MSLLDRFNLWLAERNTKPAPIGQAQLHYAWSPSAGKFTTDIYITIGAKVHRTSSWASSALNITWNILDYANPSNMWSAGSPADLVVRNAGNYIAKFTAVIPRAGNDSMIIKKNSIPVASYNGVSNNQLYTLVYEADNCIVGDTFDFRVLSSPTPVTWQLPISAELLLKI